MLRKTFVSLGLALMTLFASPGAEAQYRDAPRQGQGYGGAFEACVTGVGPGDTLNVRARPTVRSAVVGELPRNACEIFSTCENGWCRVAGRGPTGWAAARYLRISGRGGPAHDPIPAPGVCGWYAVLGSLSTREAAIRHSERIGAYESAAIVRNAELPNFTPGYFSVVFGPFASRGHALRQAARWRGAVPDAYAKAGC